MEIYSQKNGVTSAFIKNERFKANMLTIRFLLPLSEKTVTENAMAAQLICSSTKAYPKNEELSLKLMQLYGANISATTEKLSGSQLITLRLTALKNGMGFNSENCFSEALNLLFQVVFNPNALDGAFDEDEVHRVKNLWCDKIDAEINDKRKYAKNRLQQIMYKGMPFGTNRYGYKEAVQKADAKSLYNAYKRLIEEAQIHIIFTGAEYQEKFVSAFCNALPNTERYVPYNECIPVRQVTEATERLNISQGKLVMGFRLGSFGDERKTYINAVAVDIFGGGTYSKLFSEVREKMGLCYYCSATANRYMGAMFVESGVDEVNAERAKEAILSQLNDLQNGKFSDEVLLSSKRSFLNSLNAVGDSLASIDGWYGARIVQENPLSPKELSELICSVTREQVIEAAKQITPDTIFFLLGEKDGAQND